MAATDIILTQLADPFRIGLIVFLIVTMQRTRDVTGIWLPLAAGALFVAVIIPINGLGMQSAGFMEAVLYGLVTNAILIGAGLALWSIYARLRG